ncbi:MAG: 2-isopropylmalate synthase, partial [Lachnospiraceae bacterium]|nr:2-isopropylmalate synthase [Lachnospiraceae bacterium]
MLNYKHYTRRPGVELPDRKWPSAIIKSAPVWCSVDLRDGNQALIEPMAVEEKIEFFKMLVKLGFKEIEVGFPSASQIEFDFIRQLHDRRLIPDDVSIQVLTQCRDHLLEKTFESIEGLSNVIFHIYNPTSPIQRDVVFGMEKKEIEQIAVKTTQQVKEFAKYFPGRLRLEYTPESFMDTELDFALEICDAVSEVWQPTKRDKMIVNLPTTMETNTPNVFADRIEWMSDRLARRDRLVISIHPHNDRGTGIAVSELGMLAGADRIEGTLFGNGERTGNVDIMTLAYNLMSQGINPKLNLENVLEIKEAYERLCRMPVHPRHPYAGTLVFTAFSGGHQDAISKAMKVMAERDSKIWNIPYLPIDPVDVGRVYEPIVRINSQSGMGGIAFIMEIHHGFKLPKGMQKEFSDIIQAITEEEGELDSNRIMWEFKTHYIDAKEPYHFRSARMEDVNTGDEVADDFLDGAAPVMDEFHTHATITYTDHGVEKTFEARGNGPIDAVKIGIARELGRTLRILDYSEHALREGSNAQAAAYIHLMDPDSGKITYGVGVSSSTTRASIRAIFS